MTREELVKIMEHQWVLPQSTDDCFTNIADRILAAIEKEREGEVVLGDGELEVGLNACLAFTGYKDLMRKQGQLIFRPTKAEKGVE